MVEFSKANNGHQVTETTDQDVINRLVFAIRTGEHWYPALLEAVGSWVSTMEEYRGRRFTYLIGGEAFDWLLVAERLCDAVGELIPEDEKTVLLFSGQPPLVLPNGQFKESLGEKKYLHYLNYFYGVTVEEALITAVEEEVRKERWSWGVYRGKDNTTETYRRIYGVTMATLLRRFRTALGYPQEGSITLGQMKEFTYWLFKLRLQNSDKARVASDTKKGLNWLLNRGFTLCPEQPETAPGTTGERIKSISQGLV